MQTLALMLMATIVSVVIGVPMGILVTKSRVVRNITLPVLDVMQTMPSFVYLIPALMLFGLGKVPAILATIIYAVPPLIRLPISASARSMRKSSKLRRRSAAARDRFSSASNCPLRRRRSWPASIRRS